MCEKQTTHSLVDFPIIKVSLKVVMPLKMKSDIYPVDCGANAMIKRFLLKSMIGEPTFVDTRYFVFSRRTGTKVHTPRVVFGNSYILKVSSEYFEAGENLMCIQQNVTFIWESTKSRAAFRDNSFLESKATDLSGPYPEAELDHTHDYGYGSDSDLDEDEDDECSISSSNASVATVPFKHPALRIPKHLRGKTMIIKDFAFRTYVTTNDVYITAYSTFVHLQFPILHLLYMYRGGSFRTSLVRFFCCL